MKESLETVLFLDLTRKNAAFALRTSKRMGNHYQNKTPCNPGKKSNARMPHPIANACPDGQNRKSTEVKPSLQLWKISDSVTPPFLIPFVIILWLMLKRENDPFHTAMLLDAERRVQPLRANDNGKATRRNPGVGCHDGLSAFIESNVDEAIEDEPWTGQ